MTIVAVIFVKPTEDVSAEGLQNLPTEAEAGS